MHGPPPIWKGRKGKVAHRPGQAGTTNNVVNPLLVFFSFSSLIAIHTPPTLPVCSYLFITYNPHFRVGSSPANPTICLNKELLPLYSHFPLWIFFFRNSFPLTFGLAQNLLYTEFCINHSHWTPQPCRTAQFRLPSPQW